jgi:probable rRNA maturation factor
MCDPDSSLTSFRRAPGALQRNAIERFARKLRDHPARGAEFHCLITNDAEVRRLNAEFRGKDYATDVLSFPAEPLADARGPVEPASGCYLGDLAISATRARAQGLEYGHTTEREIQILMLHGLLHLLGYDHETDRGRMRRAEARWRARLGLPAGLIERVQS